MPLTQMFSIEFLTALGAGALAGGPWRLVFSLGLLGAVAAPPPALGLAFWLSLGGGTWQ